MYFCFAILNWVDSKSESVVFEVVKAGHFKPHNTESVIHAQFILFSRITDFFTEFKTCSHQNNFISVIWLKRGVLGPLSFGSAAWMKSQLRPPRTPLCQPADKWCAACTTSYPIVYVTALLLSDWSMREYKKRSSPFLVEIPRQRAQIVFTNILIFPSTGSSFPHFTYSWVIFFWQASRTLKSGADLNAPSVKCYS